MTYTLFLGRALTIMVWAMMIYNLVRPFGGEAETILNSLLFLTSLMHCMQMLMLHALYAHLMPLSRYDYLRVFVFGVFGLMEYRHRLNDYKAYQQALLQEQEQQEQQEKN